MTLLLPQRRQRRLLPAGVRPSLVGGVGAVCGDDDGGEGQGVRHCSTQVADGGPQEGSPPWWRRRARLVVGDYYSLLLVILTELGGKWCGNGTQYSNVPPKKTNTLVANGMLCLPTKDANSLTNGMLTTA